MQHYFFALYFVKISIHHIPTFATLKIFYEFNCSGFYGF